MEPNTTSATKPSIFDESEHISPPDRQRTPPVEPSGPISEWNPQQEQFRIAGRFSVVLVGFVMLYLASLFAADLWRGEPQAVHNAWDRLQFFINIGFAATIGWLFQKRS
jgi:hypothetical protein